MWQQIFLKIAIMGAAASIPLAGGSVRAADSEAKVRVLVVTGGHDFEKAAFKKLFATQDALDLSWASSENQESPFVNTDGWSYDTVVLYNFKRRLSDDARTNFLELMDRGVGLVILHHAVAAYPKWPMYNEILGGRYFLKDQQFRGRRYDRCRFEHDVRFRIEVVADEHPITRSLPNFTVHDETYKGQWIAPDVDVLLATEHESSDRPVAWAHTFRESRVCYMQPGHGPTVFTNPDYQRLVSRAIHWTAK